WSRRRRIGSRRSTASKRSWRGTREYPVTGQRTWVGRRDRREPPVEHGRYITCGSEGAIGGDCLQVAERVLAGFGRQVEEVCSQGWPGGFGGESGNVVVGWSSSATVWGSTSCSAATWGPEALDIVSR